ncbi:MAG: TM0996/MTH895 family glutaredoxin-like protein [Bacteroidales bacterium]|nr:TM0996/MTH895 family glutaredoxin-like protein [Bacteroidales bacterium]
MTKQIKILGTGCSKCQQTTDVVTKTVASLEADAQIEKVEDIMEIMKYNVMSTPAVVVDGEVKISGRIPSKSEIESLLK